MGVIRGILLVLVVVLLFLSVVCITLFWTLSLSLRYENVEKESVIIAKDFLKGTDITGIVKQMSPFINSYCKNNSEYVFNYQGYTFDIPCSTALEGEDAIVEEGVRDLVKDVYYTEYDCSFLDCASKPQLPLFLISEKALDFFTNKLYFFLMASFILLILVFLFIEKKTNIPILVGSLLVTSSLLFIKLDSFFSLFPDNIIFKFLGIFFSQAYFVSLRVLVIGIVLIVAGIVLKVFKIGFFISNIIAKSKEKMQQKKTEKLKKKNIKRKAK